MSSVNMSLPLPVRNEQIYVQFEMPDRTKVWWKAIVEDISPTGVENIRAYATVTYEEGHDNIGNFYPAESGAVHFIDGNKLIASSTTGSFPKNSETLWKHVGGIENIFNASVNVLSNSNQKRCIADDEDYRPPASRTRKRARYECYPTQFHGNATGDHQHRRTPDVNQTATQRQCSTPDDVQVDHDNDVQIQRRTPQQEIQELRTVLGVVERELYGLRRKVQMLENRSRHQSITKGSTTIKALLRLELQRTLRRPHTKLKGEVDSPFSSILRRCPLQFSINATLSDFTNIAEELNEVFPTNIECTPALSEIISRAHPLSPKHIVFKAYHPFLSWIGISTKEDARNFTIRKIQRRDTQILQLVGGAQWDDQNTTRPLRLFVGASCSRGPPIVNDDTELAICKENEEAEMQVSKVDGNAYNNYTAHATQSSRPCISINSAEWNVEGGNFLCDFQMSCARPNLSSITTSSVYEYDAITLTWTANKSVRYGDLSFLSSPIVLGKINVFIPAVVLTGPTTCNSVISHLTAENLHCMST